MTSDIARVLEEAERGCLCDDMGPCLVCRLAAIVREQQAEIERLTTWRDPATAPKDGTTFVALRSRVAGCDAEPEIVTFHMDYYIDWNGHNVPSKQIFGWLPLPRVEVLPREG